MGSKSAHIGYSHGGLGYLQVSPVAAEAALGARNGAKQVAAEGVVAMTGGCASVAVTKRAVGEEVKRLTKHNECADWTYVPSPSSL